MNCVLYQRLQGDQINEERWARNVERRGEGKMLMVLEAELKDRGHFEDQRIREKLN